jgi:hypothetical protein
MSDYIPNSAGVDYTKITDRSDRAKWFYNQLATDPDFAKQYHQQVTDSDAVVAKRRAEEYDDGPLGNFLSKFTSSFVDNIPYLYAGLLGGSALGMFGGSAGAGAAAGAGEIGTGALGDLSFEGLGGALPINTGALTDMGWAGGLGGAGEAAAGSGATAVLGAGAGTDGIPSITVSGTAPGAGSLSSMAAAPLPVPTSIPYLDNIGNVPFPSSSLPPVIFPPMGGGTPNVDPVAEGAANLPYTPLPMGGGLGGGTGTGLPSGLPSVPGTGSGTPPGLGTLLGGLGTLGAAFNDRHNTSADTEFYKGLLDKMTGMYAPGTPEAELMRQKMEAQDAANGRRSQYGVRDTNLASMLAQQRAQIMTSPTYAHVADRYRDKYDDKNNSLYSLLGSGQGANAISGIVNGIGSIGSTIGSLFSNNPTPTR